MSSTKRKEVVPCLLLIALLLHHAACHSNLPIYRGAGSWGFPQFWPKREFVCPALPDPPTSAKGKPREQEQRVVSWSPAVARDGLCAQLLPGQNQVMPQFCHRREKKPTCISSKPHSSYLSSVSNLAQVSPEPPSWQAGQVASAWGNACVWHPTKAEAYLLSAWFHTHFIRRLWKDYQHHCLHTIDHK